MKRDWELIRKIVLAVEDHPTGIAPDLRIDGYSQDAVGYHAYLLMDAGLARGAESTSMSDSSPQALLMNLTWAGHDFADKARDESRWKSVMRLVEDRGGSITVDILGQLLGGLLKSTFGIPN